MKPIRALCLSLLVLSYGMPLPVLAQGVPGTLSLPTGRVGEAYRIDIEAVLRDSYGLRIDTGVQSSILQWLYVDGEMPPGTSVRTDGTIVGTPNTYTDGPYRFRVKVVDVATNPEPLLIGLSIRVDAPRIKLTEISRPRLVPIGTVVSASTNAEMNGALTERPISAPIMPFGDPNFSARYESSPLSAARPANPASLAMAGAPDSSPISSFLHRTQGGKKTVTINMPATSVPKLVEVRNETKVTITGSKRPVDTCVVATKREELKPEPNPLAQLLKVVIGFGTFGVASTKGVDCPADPSNDQVPGDPEAKQIEREMKSIRQSLSTNIDEISQIRTKYLGMAKAIKNFASCKGPDEITDICTTALFEGEKGLLKTDVPVLLAERLPVVESTELQLATLKKVLGDRYKKPADTDEQWLQTVNRRLDCFSKILESAKRSRDFLATARTDLEKLQDLLDAHLTDFGYKKDLLVDANSKVTGTVTCTNFFTKQVSSDVPFTVIYQNLPRATVSAGILFSLLDRRQIGIQPVRTGTAADGTPTFRLQFAESDRSSSQVIPFSFFNYYLTGTRKLNLNLSGGVGLNPNNGSNQVEYFMGGALGIKDIYLQFGGHVGRWQELGNGFVIGDAVPEKFPAAAPIERRYSIRPAFGVSYRLPLP